MWPFKVAGLVTGYESWIYKICNFYRRQVIFSEG